MESMRVFSRRTSKTLQIMWTGHGGECLENCPLHCGPVVWEGGIPLGRAIVLTIAHILVPGRQGARDIQREGAGHRAQQAQDYSAPASVQRCKSCCA